LKNQYKIIDLNRFSAFNGSIVYTRNPAIQSLKPQIVPAPAPVPVPAPAPVQNGFEDNYFIGNWDATGYRCTDNRQPPIEKVNCVNTNGQAICTKTLGDNCVTTGNETFRVQVESTYLIARPYSITYVVGNPGRPNSGHLKNQYKIIDLNRFSAFNGSIVYTRNPAIQSLKPQIVPAPAPAPVPVPVPHVDPVPVPAPVPAPVPQFLPAVHQVYYYQNYFLGTWNAVGYICNANTPKIEIINIRRSSDANTIHAKKLVGDDCVAAGEETFNFVHPEKLWQGETFNVNFLVGAPGSTQRKYNVNPLQILDLNTFKIGTHVFYRVVGPQQKPNGVYINMQPMIGKGGSYPGPAYVKLNPKSNIRHPVRRFVIVEESTDRPGNC